MTRPESVVPPSHYPVALVPGQFQEYYRKFSAAELLYVKFNTFPLHHTFTYAPFVPFRCYPVNTALADPVQLDLRLREYSRRRHDNSDSEDDSSDDSSSGSSDSSDSSDVSPRFPLYWL